MIELDQKVAIATLGKNAFVREFSALATGLSVRGFQDRRFFPRNRWYMASVPPITGEQLLFYQRFVVEYFGEPIKDYDVPIVPGENIPDDVIPMINRMNGYLFLGIAVIHDLLNLDQVVHILDEQQGASRNPPINLGNKQALYLRRITDGTFTELIRVSPHISKGGNEYSMEYMLHKRM
ncbi:hypothetical protein HYW21_07580 [Candidatus Woesearchaeota archaeon]|nr:hypothetical protein [Candidatus Woesearchaeota archaeon]